VFIKYGMLTDEKFYERAIKFMLLKNIEGKYFTLEEYKTKIEVLQKDKNDTLIYLYTNDVENQYNYIETAKQRGYDILVLDGILDNHFINAIEQKTEKSRFSRIDSDVIDKIIEKSEEIPSKLSEDEIKQLKEIFEKQIDPTKFHINTANLSDEEFPLIITQNEFMRRWKDMQNLNGQQSLMPQMESYDLIINTNHPLMSKILSETEDAKKENLTKQLVDLALLSQNILKGESLTNFVKRSLEIIS